MHGLVLKILVLLHIIVDYSKITIYKKKLNKGDVMGEFLNNYVLKSREDNGRCDVLAIFTDLIYVDVDEDKPFGPKLIKNEETRPNNNLISLSF